MKKTKVCLINPPHVVPKKWGWGHGANVFQPLGIAYIAAVLEQNGYSVAIIDALALGWRRHKELPNDRIYAGISLSELREKIEEVRPNVVGITIPFSSQAETAFATAETVKSISSKIVVVVGGPHSTARPEECIKNANIDIVVIGEAEYSTLELLQALEEGKELNQIKGLVYKKNGHIITTERREYIANLDSLPFPARHLLPMKEYFQAARRGKTSRNMMANWATIITSRGCPYACVFCSIHVSMGRHWRYRSPENVIQEIVELIDKWKVKHIDFEDDNLTLDSSRIEKICDLIIKNNFHLTWETPNGIRSEGLHEGLLRKMRRSGCHRLYLSPESGDQKVVDDIIGKKINLKKVEEVVKACRKVGIKVTCSFVIGLIGETKENIQKTIEFAKKLRGLGADRFGFNIATPYYGSQLYQQASEKGYLTERFRDNLLSSSETLIRTPEFTPEELYALKEEAQAINFRLSIDNLKVAIKDPSLIAKALSSLIRIIWARLRKTGRNLK